MIVKKTKFKNGREIYRKADFLEKIKYYEDEIYSIVFSVGMLVVMIFLFTGIIEYEFLKKQKLISDSKAQVSECTIANGDTTKCFMIKIAQVSIGDTYVKNVDCLVMENPDAPLLLGMNVLNGLGGVSINYKRKLLILR